MSIAVRKDKHTKTKHKTMAARKSQTVTSTSKKSRRVLVGLLGSIPDEHLFWIRTQVLSNLRQNS